jgi:replicative DNA helicase
VTETTARVHLAPVDEQPEPDRPEVIAERAVLGTAIQSSAGAAEALAAVRPEWMSRNAHRAVLEAVERLASAGTAVDPQAVMGELASAGLLARVGAPNLGNGGVYLHSLITMAGQVSYHAPVIIAAARQRSLMAALDSCRQLAGDGFDPDGTPEQVRKIIADAASFAEAAPLRPNSDAVLRVLEALETQTEPGMASGYPELDDAISGLQPEKLYVIGARPGHGKSLISACIADHVATRLGLPVLFSSLEMTEDELTERRISALSKVPLKHITSHQVNDAEWDMIARAKERLLDTQLYVDDASGQTIAHVRGRLAAMQRTGDPVRLLVVDYLGFVKAPNAESRQQQVSSIARDVKMLAREFRVPVILLCQLNRGPEMRSDHIPVSADLRESGEVEQTADVVILLHKPDAYEQESPRAGEIDLLITKNRQGPLTTIPLLFQGHYGRIVSLSREWTPHSSAPGGVS